MKNFSIFRKFVYFLGTGLLIGGLGVPPTASALTLSDSPLFLSLKAPPLNLLVMGRDHKLYYEAYNDASDLDNDGTLDIGYKGYVLVDNSDPTKGYKIDYFGYFDSYKCYSYTSSVFTPTRTTTNKKCTVVTTEWSGDFLNYLTMSRMDVLRKVLFGGRRSTDTATSTVLERAYIPQDTHSWAKEYTDVATDGYDIAEFTSLSLPTAGTRHLFANTTSGSSETANNPPLLRVLTNRTERMWEWVSREVLQAGTTIGTATAVTPTDYVVRVQVCVTGLIETANCKLYGTSYKPTGLLQDNANDMKFGLITGSYTKNLSGGVLRKLIGSITDEINSADGTFTSTNGIISTISKLRVRNYSGTHATAGNSCGLFPTAPLAEGSCRAWGNPIAEMMYEGLRYYAGKASPTTAFDYTNTSAGAPDDYNLGLPKVGTWTNPYGSGATQNPWCAKPTMLVISDIYPSYDTDQLPGVDSNFGGGLTGDLPASLNVGTLAQTIWDTEQGATGVTKSHFIGQVGATYDGAATAKTVGSFSNIRGLAPEEPTKKGGYYSASIAYWGHINDVNPISGGASDLTGQKLDFYTVALSPPMPKIDIKVGANTITLIPFAKSVAGVSINPASGQFQPTNSLARVFVQSLTSTSGTFRVNFEDQEQGNDFDMDSIAQYSYTVSGSTVDVTVALVSAVGGITQHMGYVISGTTADGTYLDIRDETACGSDTDYFLDTPNVVGCLPTTMTRTFTPSTTPAATLLKDPLWYTAKWGGFRDSDGNDKPNLTTEWDVKNSSGAYTADQVPDNYFYVSNPLGLAAALNTAFDSILKDTGTASSVAVNTASLSTDSYVYQAKFTSSTWSGQLLAKRIDPDTGVVATTATWDSALKLESQNWDTGRAILTWNPNSAATRKGVPFRWTDIGSTNQTALGGAGAPGYGQEKLNFLRGDSTNEAATSNPSFRARNDSGLGGHFKLGDVVNSAPIYVGAPPFLYPDTLETATYSSFRNARASRTPIVYVGANDGMLHGFNACAVTTQPGCSDASQHGKEVIAYVPAAAYPNLSALTLSSYGSSHKYFVDLSPTAGDVFGDFSATVSTCTAGCWRTLVIGGMRAGGKAYFALDVTDPSVFSEGASQAANQILWEYTHADLGNSFSEVTITKMNTGSGTRWAAIFGNGYNSTSGKAALFIVDAVTGTLIRKIDVDTIGSNGLSTPAVVDIDGDYIADYVYAGDLKGNMWKFDVTSNNEITWDSYYRTGTTPKPLYKAVDGSATPVAQPITSRPEVGNHPDGLNGYMVYFGTGKYLEVGDNNPGATPSPTHTFYGLWDQDTNGNGGTPIIRADLLPQTITEGTYRTVSNDPIYWNGESYAGPPAFTGTHKGWRVDMLTTTAGDLGEMVVTNPILRSTRVIFTTLIPDTQQCTSGGSSWLMELNYQNGGQLPFDVFDINNDGVFNSSDRGGGSTMISGVRTGIGISPTPTMIDDPAKGRELKVITGSSGATSSVANNPGPLSPATGRRSWRQLK